MDELLDSNVPLVDKDSGCSAVILPACKTTTLASTAASTLEPLSVVHYKSSNISPATSTTDATEATTATTASTAISAPALLPASQQGPSTAKSSSEPVPLLNQLQSLPLQKPNDLKQCNALYGQSARPVAGCTRTEKFAGNESSNSQLSHSARQQQQQQQQQQLQQQQ
ncbi:hypothetical protein AWZ03_006867 [Drosophila navojoa]|uniref:Uncharacterized protein n=1 Tax=Drosophila navojoa TaxID=7232 RepID=A0A484BCW5_DRONA|nr:hypothetical protein AWZ03_006867 [Drosophila navojoa]